VCIIITTSVVDHPSQATLPTLPHNTYRSGGVFAHLATPVQEDMSIIPSPTHDSTYLTERCTGTHWQEQSQVLQPELRWTCDETTFQQHQKQCDVRARGLEGVVDQKCAGLIVKCHGASHHLHITNHRRRWMAQSHVQPID